MEYNTTRSKLVISEYGRNIQKLIEYAITIEDREKRNRVAKGIVNVMGQINPSYKENNEHKQKLWDHLFIISNFKLDVDSPFPKPSPEIINTKPEKVSYPSNNIHYKHYGRNIEKIIEKAAEMEDGEEKEALKKTIANHLKKSYLHWNRSSINDNVISDHLAELSNGQLELADDVRLNNTREILARTTKRKHTKHTSNNNRGRRRVNK